MKNRKILLSLLTGAVLMLGIGGWIGNGLAQPMLYRKAIRIGAQDLQKQKYEKALAQFQRAVDYDRNTTQGRLGMAYAYLGLGNASQAADILQRAQQENVKDDSFLRECLEVLRIPEPKAAYNMLKRYREAVGEENMPSDLKKMWTDAQTLPAQPKVTPEPDAYASAITVALDASEISIGHRYYFTLDGTTPDKKSFSYQEPIVLSENTKLTIIGYNAQGEAGEAQTFEYEIDNSLRQKLKRIYSQATDATATVEVGEDPGQVSQDGMDRLKTEMKNTKKVLAKELLTKEEAESAYQDIGEAFTYFEDEVVPETDKTKLQDQIQKAEQLIQDLQNDSSMKDERDKLKTVLQDAKSVYDDRTASQDEVDDSRKLLRAAIESAEQADQSEFTTKDSLNMVVTWARKENLSVQVTTPAGDTIGDGSFWGFASGGRMRADGQKRTNSGYYSQVTWAEPPSGSYEIQVSAPEDAEENTAFRVQIITDESTWRYSGTVQPGKTKTYSFQY